MTLQESIRIILKEETNKFELVKNFIYTMYDNVRFVEYNTKFNEVMVYYTNHDKRQMLIPTEICEMITNYTGLDVVPWHTDRESNNQPDFYLDTEEYEEKLNESEDKGGKFINLIEDLTEDFKNEDCVCDIKISYKSEEFRDLYLITVVLGNRDIDDKFGGHNITRERNYKSKLKRKITDEVLGFLPIPFFVEFEQTPKCKDYKNLKESIKKI